MKTSFPLFTVLLGIATVAIHPLPGSAEALQFDRTALAAGEYWRILTGHFTHFDANHLAWDVGAFLALGILCERQSRRAFGVALILAGITVPIAVLRLQPQFAIYRGLSGLDSALFGCLAVSFIQQQRRASIVVGTISLVAVGAKCAYEVATGSTAFALGLGYAPVPLAHLVGAASGAIAALLVRSRCCRGAGLPVRQAQGPEPAEGLRPS